MQLKLGIKSDPVQYRYSYPWLFRLMAEEGITSLQLGSFFELYQLPDEYFIRLRKQAGDFGISIDSLFTAHRELGGFYREDPEWIEVAYRNYRRFIEIGSLLGASSVGSNPGAVPRDLMGIKEEGNRCYLEHMKKLMHYAYEKNVSWLTVEPMSCLAEPPTLPEEMRAMGEELEAYHQKHPDSTARAGFCTDIAHGYLNVDETKRISHIELFEASLPWLYEIHLKNTDDRFHSTFGFEPENVERGIVDVTDLRRRLMDRAELIPVGTLGCYLEIGGPKLGRDYSDTLLEEQIRQSLRYLKDHFLEEWNIHQISIHAESSQHLDRSLESIRTTGAQAGIAINPATALETLDYVLERIDYVLLMTVNPGFAGQKLTPASIRKITDCRKFLDARGYGHLPIQVDGNVSFEHIPAMVAAGAENLVAGTSSIFHADASWPENLKRLHAAIEQGLQSREMAVAA